jgi:uncharacterized protein (DUF3084 family)
MVYVLIAALLVISGILWLIGDSLHFQKIHPDDLASFAPTYGLDSDYKGEE